MSLPGGLRTGVRPSAAKRHSTYLNQKGCHSALEELAPNLIRGGEIHTACSTAPARQVWIAGQARNDRSALSSYGLSVTFKINPGSSPVIRPMGRCRSSQCYSRQPHFKRLIHRAPVQLASLCHFQANGIGAARLLCVRFRPFHIGMDDSHARPRSGIRALSENMCKQHRMRGSRFMPETTS